MNRNTKTTLLVAGLVLVGFLLGLAAGSGGDEPQQTAAAAAETVTVARTDTVTRTETVVRTRTRVKYRTRVKVRYRTVTEPAPAAAPVAADSSDGCSPEYAGACVPDDAGDVNCTDLYDTDFDSVGSDPYGLDRDGDGIACES